MAEMAFPSLALAPVVQALQHTFSGATLSVTMLESPSHGDIATRNDTVTICTVQPTTSEEVSKFIRAITPFVFREDLLFAIQDGGIAAPPGDEEVKDNTVILDLSQINSVVMKSDEIAAIGAGARWDNVLADLGSANLSVASARNGGRGIGKLALEAGLSFFSSSRGFVGDNVVNYEIVLASGDIVDANAAENADLWASLKGGSNNFGIVTRYDMETFSQGPLWGGYVYYYVPNFPHQLDLMVRELRSPEASPDTHIILTTAYAARMSQTVCVNRVYHTKGLGNSSSLTPFTTMTPQVDGLGSLGLISVKDAAETSGAGLRRAHMDTTVKADTATLQAATDLFTSHLDPIKSINDTNLVASITFEPLPVSLIQAAIARSGNVFGLDPSGGPLVSISLVVSWTRKADDDKIIQHFKGVLQKIKADAIQRGQAVDFELMSTAFHFQDPIASYGADIKRRMQAVSRKYDPNGLLRKGLRGGFKLFP